LCDKCLFDLTECRSRPSLHQDVPQRDCR
jgi:hypothetical protein